MVRLDPYISSSLYPGPATIIGFSTTEWQLVRMDLFLETTYCQCSDGISTLGSVVTLDYVCSATSYIILDICWVGKQVNAFFFILVVIKD